MLKNTVFVSTSWQGTLVFLSPLPHFLTARCYLDAIYSWLLLYLYICSDTVILNILYC